MSKQNPMESFCNKDANTDALFGVVHVKDQAGIHQKVVNHLFEETGDAGFVPMETSYDVDDESKGKVGKILKMLAFFLVIAGIVAFFVYLAQIKPELLNPFV